MRIIHSQIAVGVYLTSFLIDPHKCTGPRSGSFAEKLRVVQYLSTYGSLH